jgi:hypothetical protein
MIPIAYHRLRLLHFPVFVVCLLAWLSPAARAGGGPENVLLVVNRNSPNSLTIANYYVRLRQIPPANVLTLPWDPKTETTDIDTFRKVILQPVLETIRKRHLALQIDYVVYSSDFPTTIELDKDVERFLAAARSAAASEDEKSNGQKPDDQKPEGKPAWPMHLTKFGSLNGLTYLWQPVAALDPANKPRQGNGGLAGTNPRRVIVPAYMDLQSNRYLRRQIAAQKDAPTLGFRSSHRFGPEGELLPSFGRSYVLSMMLGITAGRGNSLDEVLRYLQRSVAADGTHPRGTVYFVENSDVRSKVRQHMFPAAVKKLKELGVAAEIVEGVMPLGKDDVQGVMMGTASFKWKSAHSTILPGAICDHFTSYGGAMSPSAGQTPLSEFLCYGAAGASGTVTEPFALVDKFPLPSIHVHYARGCTLAEAFYQSVSAPYQLLIVGDPLCRPWANIPQVKVAGVEPGATVHGTLTLKPTATLPGKSKVERFELFVDELRAAFCPPGGALVLDTARLADGYHQLRVVAVEAGPIQSQGRCLLPITAANHARTIQAAAAPRGAVRAGKPLVITAEASASTGIAVLHYDHLLGTITGKDGKLEIDPEALGFGPVSLRAVGLGSGGPGSYVWAEPIELTVEKGP